MSVLEERIGKEQEIYEREKAAAEEKLGRRMKKIRALQSADRQRERLRQARRDRILGSIIRKHADSLLTRTIDAIVDKHVTNERERALFGLEELVADPVPDMETSPAVAAGLAAGKAEKKPATQKKRRPARKPRRDG